LHWNWNIEGRELYREMNFLTALPTQAPNGVGPRYRGHSDSVGRPSAVRCNISR
jgi:hypothetical protein